jgi:hypothetical protein
MGSMMFRLDPPHPDLLLEEKAINTRPLLFEDDDNLQSG